MNLIWFDPITHLFTAYERYEPTAPFIYLFIVDKLSSHIIIENIQWNFGDIYYAMALLY